MLGKVLVDLFRTAQRGKVTLESKHVQFERENPLEVYCHDNPGCMMVERERRLKIYHRHFANFRGRSPVVAEIGMRSGGSPQMWRYYFGPEASTVGIDMENRTVHLADGMTVQILTGTHSDQDFLASVRKHVPHIDIVIDSRNATAQQIAVFEMLYSHMQPNGIYLCDDINTTPRPTLDGGYQQADVFIDYGKALVDRLYAGNLSGLEVSPVETAAISTHSIHVYSGMLVLEKGPIT